MYTFHKLQYTNTLLVLLEEYSRNCYLRPPLGAAKTSLKQQAVCERGSLRHAIAKSTAAVYTDIVHLCASKFTQKVVLSLPKPTTRYMCTQLWSHSPGEWLCASKSVHSWSPSSGSHSPQKLFCAKSSMHGISVIKTRWSFNTEIVNNSFSVVQCITLVVMSFKI